MKAFTALAVALPLVYAKVSYEGYRAYHIDSDGDHDAIWDALNDLEHVSLGCESHPDNIEVAIGPKDLDTFESLGFNYTVTTKNLGAAIAKEKFEPYEGRYTISPRHDERRVLIPVRSNLQDCRSRGRCYPSRLVLQLVCLRTPASSPAYSLDMIMTNRKDTTRMPSTTHSSLISRAHSLPTRSFSPPARRWRAALFGVSIYGEPARERRLLSGTATSTPESG